MLTKTEEYLLEAARQHGGTYSVEYGYGRGAKGGRITYGVREHSALIKLRDKNLVRITHSDKSPLWTGNGNTVHASLVRFEII